MGHHRGRWGLAVIRGDLYLVNFEPAVGSEANKTRPAVLVSNDHANASSARTGRGVVTVVPVTSNVNRVYDFQVRISTYGTGLRTTSKAQAEQVRSVNISRLGLRLGALDAKTLDALNDALALHLGLTTFG